ncbi:UNVERIFIED_CONTAM: hypothetical protein Sradi_0123400 [Sesamum radiatum]|uniref:Serine aminopeptidase S33 domain-containing protein n=1 Tax=Sesamum radiatum TaxID=300843 RepID=A0AAW2WKF9_SESRA
MAADHRFFLDSLAPVSRRRRCMGVGAAPESSEKCGGKDEKSSSTTGKVVRVPAAMVPRKSAAAAVDKEWRRGGRWRLRGCSKNNEDNRDTSREFSLFVTSRGDTIFYSVMDTGESSSQGFKLVLALHSISKSQWKKGMVVLLHGLNEHSGRYNAFAKKLNANGFKVYGMDWIGELELFYIEIVSIFAEIRITARNNVIMFHFCALNKEIE